MHISRSPTTRPTPRSPSALPAGGQPRISRRSTRTQQGNVHVLRYAFPKRRNIGVPSPPGSLQARTRRTRAHSPLVRGPSRCSQVSWSRTATRESLLDAVVVTRRAGLLHGITTVLTISNQSPEWITLSPGVAHSQALGLGAQRQRRVRPTEAYPQAHACEHHGQYVLDIASYRSPLQYAITAGFSGVVDQEVSGWRLAPIGDLQSGDASDSTTMLRPAAEDGDEFHAR